MSDGGGPVPGLSSSPSKLLAWLSMTVVRALAFLLQPLLRFFIHKPRVKELSRFFSPAASPGPRKTLVLDLDETLIHSHIARFAIPPQYDLRLDVEIEQMTCTFFVKNRPHVDVFLETVAKWYDVVVFTASLREYGDPVISFLDKGRNLFKARYFREESGLFMKNLSTIRSDLANVIIIDNSPGAYELQPENAIPILTWTEDPLDEQLLDLLPLLDALRFTDDVRSVLSLRMHRS